MSRRLDFVEDVQLGLYSMTEPCARYGLGQCVSCKWLVRYDADGADGLVDHRRVAKFHPHRMPEDVAARLLARAPNLRPAQASGLPGAAAPVHVEDVDRAGSRTHWRGQHDKGRYAAAGTRDRGGA